MLEIWCCLLRSIDKGLKKKDIYKSDRTGTHQFLICSRFFPFEWVEGEYLVNCGDFSGDCSSIHVTRSDFRSSEDKEGLFGAITDTFMLMEVIIFIWSALISLIVFSNIGSGSNDATSILLFVLFYSNYR